MRSVFVTGTDTGVGKTIITGLLAKFLDDKGYKVITQKWIETGSVGFPKDVNSHLRLIGKKRRKIRNYLSDISPYTFKFPYSPHLASSLEKRKISIERIKKSFKSLQKAFDFVVVEGIGGALVPLNKRELVIDAVKEIDLPVVVVAGNKLGAINHTLLTIEALRRRKIKIAGVIFNNMPKRGGRIMLADNPKIVKQVSRENILGTLPYSNNKGLLYKKFIPIAKRISNYLNRAS